MKRRSRGTGGTYVGALPRRIIQGIHAIVELGGKRNNQGDYKILFLKFVDSLDLPVARQNCRTNCMIARLTPQDPDPAGPP